MSRSRVLRLRGVIMAGKSLPGFTVTYAKKVENRVGKLVLCKRKKDKE